MMGVATRVQQKAHEVSNTMMGVATRVQQKAHEVSNMIMGVATLVQQKAHEAWMIYQHYVDKINAHPTYRWIVTLVVALAFCLRVYYTRFYLIVFGLALSILHLLVEFLSPLLDPVNDAPYLPIRASDEFKPFIRRLPEFKFWFSMTMAFCISLVLTFFPEFNIPLKWQLLLICWLGLLIIAIKSLISEMIKYKYIPFSFGKKKYGDRSSSGSRAE